MYLSSSPGWTVYVPPFWSVGDAMGAARAAGVAVACGVAVGGARVGGGAAFDETGRLTIVEPVSDGIKLDGEARLVPGSWANASTITASGSRSAKPRTRRSAPPDELYAAEPADFFDTFD